MTTVDRVSIYINQKNTPMATMFASYLSMYVGLQTVLKVYFTVH